MATILEFSPRHYADAQGKYLGAFYGDARPPAGALLVDAAPGPDYRVLRMTDYAAELGKDPGDIIKTLGDVLDVTIAELVARGPAVTPEFDAMLRKIAAIKARHPKGGGG